MIFSWLDAFCYLKQHLTGVFGRIIKVGDSTTCQKRDLSAICDRFLPGPKPKDKGIQLIINTHH